MITKYPSVILYLILLLYTNLTNIDYLFGELLIFFMVFLYLLVRLFINNLYFIIITSLSAIAICELNKAEKIHFSIDKSEIIKRRNFKIWIL